MEQTIQQNKALKIEPNQVKLGDLITETHNGNTKIWRAIFNNHEYIAKGILKDSIETHDQLQHVFNERDAMEQINHHAINKIIATFKDEKYLYLLLEFVEGLPIHKIFQMHGQLTPTFSKLIIFQLLDQLKEIHNKGFIYRDIKASNLIVNNQGKMTLIDFGFAKKIERQRTKSFCGTKHAMAPEFFDPKIVPHSSKENLEEIGKEEGVGYSYEVDYYAIGILLYEMLVGKPPLGYEPSDVDITNGVTQDVLDVIQDDNTKDFISQLLEKNPEKRLGAKNGIQELINHSYLSEFDCQIIQKYKKNEKIDENDRFQYELQYFLDEIDDFGLYKQNNNEQNLTQDEINLQNSEQMQKLNDIFS